MNEEMHLSIVIPVYNAEKCIVELYNELRKALKNITDNFEIIFVEDGSADASWEVMLDIAKTSAHVKVIKLSRNFGQHPAITAGLEFSRGEYVVVMDCDLQDSPSEIKKLYTAIIDNDYDLVLASRKNRQDSIIKIFFSRAFYKTYSYCVGQDINPNIANFGIYTRKVINAFLSLKEQHKLFPVNIKWLGFKSLILEVNHGKRFEGETSYNFKKLFTLALNNIVSNSGKPLALLFKFGFIVSFLSLGFGFYQFFRWMILGNDVQGWTSLIVSLYFLAGIIIMSIGVVGIYVLKIFEETKGRPTYVINKKINIDDKQHKN